MNTSPILLTLLLSLPLAVTTLPGLQAQARKGHSVAKTARYVGQRPPELGVEFHRGRRKALMKALGSGIILMRGGVTPASNRPFVQEHNFFYLTGVRDPGCELLLVPETGDEILFVPPHNPMTARWEGASLQAGEKGEKKTGIAKVMAATTLQKRSSYFAEVAAALERCGEDKTIWICFAPEEISSGSPDYLGRYARSRKRDVLDGRGDRADAFRAALQKLYGETAKIKDLSRTIYALRAIKTPEEIELIRYVSEIACLGHAEAIKACRPGQLESELAAVADYTFRRNGAQAIGYSAIVGSGPNGNVLHHWRNNRVMEKGDNVVMDFAPEIDCYTSDVTRTFPVGGRFTRENRKLVQDVWDAQQAIIKAVRPGVSFRDLSRIGSKLLVSRGYKPGVHILHGPCHFVGMAVHDPSGGKRTLEPGMVITVEPGAYIVEEKRGCRIEDVILVTENGCEVLSQGCPSKPDAIEDLMKRQGLAEPPRGADAPKARSRSKL